MKRLFRAVSALFVWIGCTNAVAAVPLSDYLPHPSSDEFYSEQWSASFWDDDGTYLHVQFVISNIGVGDGKGAVKLEKTAIDGTRLSAKKTLDSKWSADKASFGLSFGASRFEASGDALVLHAVVEDLDLEVTIHPMAPAWAPGGDGPILHTSDGSFSTVLLAPRAEFSGTFSSNGVKRAVHGVGLVDHSWTTLAPHKLAKRWVKFKFFAGDTTCLFTGFRSPDASTGLDHGWLWIGRGSKVLLASAEVKSRFAKHWRDEASRNAYRLPRSITLEASDRACNATIGIREKKLLRRKDISTDLGFFERAVVAKVSEPVDYTFNGEFILLLDSCGDPPSELETIRENRDYVIQVINP